jgi:octaprenyl-diphosphate synthase
LRPLLLLLCARATNYQGEHHHLMAVVIELIHTATLLHDDSARDALGLRITTSLKAARAALTYSSKPTP